MRVGGVSEGRSFMIAAMFRRIGRILEDAWVYLGSLAAMSLLVGVLGMGIYHMVTWREHREHVEFFRGAFNTADESLPQGVDPLPACVSRGESLPHIRFEYEPGGRLKRLVHVDGEGEVCAMPGSRVAEQRIRYDALGRVVSKSNYGADGKPAPDAAGVASRHFTYDEHGHCVRTELRGADGRLVCPKLPGYAVERASYDAQGRPLLVEYLDAREAPVVNAMGESRLEYAYDDVAHESHRRNFVNGSPADNVLGYAVEQRSLTDDGRGLQLLWLNAAQEPVVNSSVGAAMVQRWPQDARGIERERFCSGGGERIKAGGGCAERVLRRDARGRLLSERFLDEEGELSRGGSGGYAERHCEYRADGSLERELFTDADGNPAACAERRYLMRGPDGVQLMLVLHRDGSTELRRADEKTGA